MPYFGQQRSETRVCSACNGDGHNSGQDDPGCWSCDSKGYIEYLEEYTKCSRCDGKGRYSNGTVCEKCLGEKGHWRQIASYLKKSCFITTAACEYQELPDDCLELVTMRKFRDDYLLKTEEGRQLVKSYYEIAPRMINLLNKERDMPLIWCTIQECVSLITAEEWSQAIATYKVMLLTLCNRIGWTQDISEMPVSFVPKNSGH